MQLASDLWRLIRTCHRQLRSLDEQQPKSNEQRLVSLAGDQAESPILALLTPFPRQLADHCQRAGFVVRPVVPPTVPEGTERVRVCLHSGNTFEEIQELIHCIKRWVAKSSQDAVPSGRYIATLAEQNEDVMFAKL